MVFRTVTRDDRQRRQVEAQIRSVYGLVYGAAVRSFPELLIAEFDTAETVRCAAGLRLASDGFFSECYLDHPLEDALGRLAGAPVGRDRIVEVTNLASAGVCSSARLIENIIGLAQERGAEWAVFTVTKRLRQLLCRLGLPLIALAPAVQSRVSNPEDWGRYYETSPVVTAMRDPGCRLTLRPPASEGFARAGSPVSGTAERLAHAHG